ncbi:antirestriction protein ArdA [Variovorax sp. RCC_210]|uniref:antirestriction protein ArdA n=1 Tax=Variovorax sp. RCC_210 TaxID=3239217 RepID=UPI003523FAA1
MTGIGGSANPRNSAIAEILRVARVPKGQSRRWYRLLEELDSWELAAVFYLVDTCNLSLATAFDGMDDVRLQEGALEDVARELFDDCYLSTIPESVHSYIDYEQFAYDCRIGGDLREFRFDGTTYTCTSGH